MPLALHHPKQGIVYNHHRVLNKFDTSPKPTYTLSLLVAQSSSNNMAPIEHDLTNSNIRPYLAFTGYLTFTSYLLYLVGHRVFYRAYKALPPSQATRHREGARKNQIDVFAGLAVLSLGVTVYYGYRFLLLSYQIWAFERGEIIPTGLWTEEGIFGSRAPKLLLGRWFHDTDLTAELWEIAMEKTRRRWWTGQLLMTSSVWSLYVSVQGRLRNIPHLWAFVALAPVTSLSFAMNLFFLAVLWTPIPISEESTNLISVQKTKHTRKTSKSLKTAAADTAITVASRTESFLTRTKNQINAYIPAKPPTWSPHVTTYILPLFLTSFHTVLLTMATNTNSFHSILRSLAVDLFLPIFLPRILPLMAGHVDQTQGTTRKRSLSAFRTFSLLSTAIYILQTAISLLDNDPGAHRHRHSLFHFHLDAERSKTARTRSAFARIIGSLTDHPAIGRIGVDVLLSSISLAAWAVMRGFDPKIILRAAGWVTKSELDVATEVKNIVAREVKSLMLERDRDEESEAEETPSPPSRRTRGKKTSATRKKAPVVEDEESEAETESVGQNVLVGEEERKPEWESGALAWGMMVLGGLGAGAAGVFGADIGF
jgi:hypothetical protein